jgi:S-adenosylmethionine/arginine decarboxylase-like enzyme
MEAHHFLGSGALSDGLRQVPADLIERVSAMVRASGLEVVGHQAIHFDGGGHTYVWILAESHLVLHHWEAEGFATLDLHVCDYQESNAGKAGALRKRLTDYCFDGEATWREMHLPLRASGMVKA